MTTVQLQQRRQKTTWMSQDPELRGYSAAHVSVLSHQEGLEVGRLTPAPGAHMYVSADDVSHPGPAGGSGHHHALIAPVPGYTV